MKLSILIPVYNEIHTLSAIIKQSISLDIDKELIIVDDCSNDSSRGILQAQYQNKPNIKVIYHEKNMGKGAAIKTALSKACGDYAIIQDADLEYDPQGLPNFAGNSPNRKRQRSLWLKIFKNLTSNAIYAFYD
ncbi:MAG: glycosyltransferase family 2 protein [Candidatus Omnitrophica bacterium]|jgi:glycosyltransferase involved in cell wall biosynthesis|nr:glycosyltransferase family 2 protein [Candidatus Omnitrophota bacterium]